MDHKKVLISENELYFERSVPNRFKGDILVLSITTVAAAFLLSRIFYQSIAFSNKPLQKQETN